MPFWITALLWALVHAPEIIAVIKELWNLVHHPAVQAAYPQPATPKAAAQKEFAAYKVTRDAKGLTALRDHWTQLKTQYEAEKINSVLPK